MRVGLLLLCSALFPARGGLAAEEGSPAPRLTLVTKSYSGRDARVEVLFDVEIERPLDDRSSLVLRPRIWLNSAGWSRSEPPVIGAQSDRTLQLLDGYFVWRRPQFEVKLGQQRVDWGRIDRISPLSLWGPRNLRDLLHEEPAGSLTSRIRYTPDERSSVEWLFAPGPSRSPLPEPGDAWWPGPAMPLEQHPPKGPSVGVRLDRSIGRADLCVVAVRRADPFPAYAATPRGLREVRARETVWGGSLVIPLGHWSTTLEWAAHRPDERKDAYVAGIAQAERTWNLDPSRALTLDLGFADRVTLDRVDPTPVKLDWPFRRAVYAVASYAQTASDGRDTTWRLTVVRQSSRDYYLNPEWSRQLNPVFRVTLGLDMLGGPRGTFFGTFRHNSRAYVYLRMRP